MTLCHLTGVEEFIEACMIFNITRNILYYGRDNLIVGVAVDIGMEIKKVLQVIPKNSWFNPCKVSHPTMPAGKPFRKCWWDGGGWYCWGLWACSTKVWMLLSRISKLAVAMIHIMSLVSLVEDHIWNQSCAYPIQKNLKNSFHAWCCLSSV